MTVEVARRWLTAGGRKVPLLTGPDALPEIPSALEDIGFDGRLFVVGDARALELHHARLTGALASAPRLAISGDEVDKTVEAVSRVWDWLVDNGAQRRDALVAFGGGVVCDLVGFAAATYMRGIGLVNAPTTLLAQVDASVGGKTGVNHTRGKNLIGAFYQPLCVVADTRLLTTLPQRAFAAGMAEVAKMAMILDADLFGRLEIAAERLTPDASDLLTSFIGRSIELKSDIVERDEREAGDRMLLNYGHTVGHALEATAGYGTLLHGEGVAVGMEAAALIAHNMGVLPRADLERQTAVLRALRLPLRWPMVLDDVLAGLSKDKKRAGAKQRWILATRVGAGVIRDDVPWEVARAAVASITQG